MCVFVCTRAGRMKERGEQRQTVQTRLDKLRPEGYRKLFNPTHQTGRNDINSQSVIKYLHLFVWVSIQFIVTLLLFIFNCYQSIIICAVLITSDCDFVQL